MKPLNGNNIVIAISLLAAFVAGIALFAAAFFANEKKHGTTDYVTHSEPFNNGDMVWESLPNNFIFSFSH